MTKTATKEKKVKTLRAPVEDAREMADRAHKRQLEAGFEGLGCAFIGMSESGAAWVMAVPQLETPADVVIPAGEGLLVPLAPALLEDIFTEWLTRNFTRGNGILEEDSNDDEG